MTVVGREGVLSSDDARGSTVMESIRNNVYNFVVWNCL